MNRRNKTILVIDDEKSMRECLEIIFGKEGYAVLSAGNGSEGLRLFESNQIDLIIQDLKMPGLSGTALLRAIRDRDQSVPVIVITAYSTWDTAVEAMRLGAYGYIKKPFENDNIKSVVERAIESRNLIQAGIDEDFKDIIGNHPEMRKLFDMIRRIAPTDATVLIHGESGTGKELIARALHRGSLRAGQCFMTINCGAFPDTLLESELFGHVKGAFTGSAGDKHGLLEVADKGTFFLDEVAEMSPQMQVKFLRVLENQEFKPVGGTTTKKVDVRYITATNRDLTEMVDKGLFREDLFYRLNVIPMNLPPLRERMEDVPLLAGHFLAKYAAKMKKPANRIDPEALEILKNCDWPGNVRELENTIQRAVALSDADVIEKDHLIVVGAHRAAVTEEVRSVLGPEGIDLEKELETLERKYIGEALQLCNGHLSNAAKLLKLTFRSIRYKVKKLGLDRKSYSMSSN
jgi:two-component system response regulator PilR (NtrC family)